MLDSHKRHRDISRLRVDKLELLRQALSAQHEVRQLRQREAQLETDLALAAAEIRRLKTQLKKAATHQQQHVVGQHHAGDNKSGPAAAGGSACRDGTPPERGGARPAAAAAPWRR